MDESTASPIDRRSLLRMIGMAAGSSAMYQAMTSLGYAGESAYTGPVKLEGNARSTSVLILGAGLAGMTAALELRKAGYRVQILEYNDRPGGRNWSLYGGDRYTELGGATQKVEFDKGLYLNPGPWRIPFHHHALIDYCRQLNVALEPFLQVNHNAYLHSANSFGGKPQRFRHIQTDFHGSLAELLARATNQGALNQVVTKEDTEILLEALRTWGALDKNFEYKEGALTSDRRGYDVEPNGGPALFPATSKPIDPVDLLKSRMWRYLVVGAGALHEMQPTMFQPVGGMGMIGKAFAQALGPGVIQYDAKVTAIKQDDSGVFVSYQNAKHGGAPLQARADYCICSIPLPVLSQIDMAVGAPMKRAIDALAAYPSSVKIGLQFKRRFWEQDEAIYGGISYTDLPIRSIGYPNSNYGSSGKGVLLGAYLFGDRDNFEFTVMSPEERIQKALEYGTQIHPQYKTEFETGVSVAWHRVPFTLGCLSGWTDDLRRQHYDNLRAFDGRLVLAGEHASGLVWQEGAILSSLDAIKRLHQRVTAG